MALVVLSHTTLRGLWMEGFGDYGVRLFFVLSAFLITGILLRQRDLRDRGDVRLLGALGVFYGRRTLRIWPAYLAFLAIVALADLPSVRADLGWHALYGSNWLFALAGGAWRGPRMYVGHLWSLSVEEQFYLAWPLLVLLTPRRFLDGTFVGAATLAIVWRGALALVLHDQGRIINTTPANLDALALGSLLAWRWHGGQRRLTSVVLWLGMALLAHAIFLAWSQRGFLLMITTGPLGASLASMWLIDRAANGFVGASGRLLSLPPVQYVGRISYGVYLWHMPLLWALGYARTSFLAAGIGAVAIASLSWFTLEQPLNALKRYLPYGRSPGSGGRIRDENSSSRPVVYASLRFAAVAAVFVMVAIALQRRSVTRPDFENVRYAEHASGPLTLDVYRGTARSSPVVVYFHGGGWTDPRRTKDAVRSLLEPYIAAGWAVANVNYRLGRDAPAPAAIDDARAAERWVRAHAQDYGFDTSSVVLAGESAGGHLALMAALDSASAPPAAVISWYGVTDVGWLTVPPTRRDFAVTWLAGQDPKAFSPISHVRSGLRPIVSIHAEHDSIVPFGQVARFHAALDSAGDPNMLVRVAGSAHPLRPSDAAASWRRTRAYLCSAQHTLCGS